MTVVWHVCCASPFAIGTTNAYTGNLVVNGTTQPVTFPGTVTATAWTTMDVLLNLTNGPANIVRYESTGQDLPNIDEIAVEQADIVKVAIAAANQSAVVNWHGQWLEGSEDLVNWSRLTNAPQPYVVTPTNSLHYFRAVK